MKTRQLVTISFIAILLGCSQTTEPETPVWVRALVSELEQEPVGNPPQSIWRYQYNGETVYYIPPQCCDQFSTLLDSKGNRLCAPDGGFTGGGDGKCPDFFKNRTDEKLIWRDERSR